MKITIEEASGTLSVEATGALAWEALYLLSARALPGHGPIAPTPSAWRYAELPADPGAGLRINRRDGGVKLLVGLSWALPAEQSVPDAVYELLGSIREALRLGVAELAREGAVAAGAVAEVRQRVDALRAQVLKARADALPAGDYRRSLMELQAQELALRVRCAQARGG